MSLSSFTQYYIRKLLRQQLKTVNGCIPCPSEVHCYFYTDLNLILKESGLTIQETFAISQKIETLVQAHHDQQISELYDRRLLSMLEQEIFELIGLRFYLSAPAVLLRVIEEKATFPFNFFLQERLCKGKGHLRKGIRYKNKIYGLVLETRLKYDPRLHQLIAVLSEQEVDFLVTTSQNRHAIWINLKSPVYTAIVNHSSRLLDKTAFLQAALRRFKEVQSGKKTRL